MKKDDATHRLFSLRPPRLRGRFLFRWVWRPVRILLLVYLGFCLVLFAIQTWLIFPGRDTQGQSDAIVQPRRDCTLTTLRTPRGERIVSLFAPALTPAGKPHPNPATRPTLLYFYGNGSHLANEVVLVELFRRLGANVAAPEYLGYGMSGGKPSEAGCYATADAAYADLLSHKEVNPRKIVPIGWSLGAAVAIDLAARKPAAGLAVFSGFTSMTAMAQRQYPWVPVSLFLRHRFESERKIARVHCPILIGHGTGDTLVPFAMADRLAAAAGGPLTRFSILDADHNDFFSLGEKTILPALQRFLDELPEE